MRSRYILDEDNNFRKVRSSFGTVLRRVLVFLVATASMAVLYYSVFALFFSTDTEKRLASENRMYEKMIPEMEEKEKLLADVVSGLQVRDNQIYKEIFHAQAPSIDPSASVVTMTALDTVPDMELVAYTNAKLARVISGADAVEENFRVINAIVGSNDFTMPPMISPLDKMSFARTGASVGEKINPFYKVPMRHNGLDLIAPAGEPVNAVADGVVISVVRSRKGLGNVVIIEHKGGYITKYAHLADVVAYKGRKVAKGTLLGYVGLSGNSFAPHLHYEVLRDTVVLDPVNHFFGSVTAEEYVNMLVMSAVTGQSMD